MAGTTKPSAGPGDTAGARLRRLRRLAGLSQARLAAAAECSDSLISKVERGAHDLDSLQVARRLARVLGVPVGELLGLAAGASSPPSAGPDDRLPPDGVGEEADGVNRRGALKTVSVLGGTLGISGLLDWLDPDEGDLLLAAWTDPAGNLNERVVRLLERNDARQQQRTHTLPIGQRLAAAEEHLRMVRRLRPCAACACTGSAGPRR